MNSYKGEYFCFQEGIRRLETAMKGIPDRVPVFAQMHEFIMHDLGMQSTEFYTNPENLVLGGLKIIKKYGLDVPYIDYDVYNIEAEALGQKVIYRDDVIPDVDRSEPLIKFRDDLKKIKTPNFNSDGRFSFVCEVNALYRECTGVAPPLNFCSPFSLAANIRGSEKIIFDIYDDPDFARELFDRLTEDVLAPWILYQKDKFPDAGAIVGSDASASIPLINIKMINEWVIPYILKLRELCGPEIYISNWIGESFLKNPEEMFEAKLMVCPKFLEGQDPDVEMLGPGTYKEYAATHNVSLVLGVGTGFMVTSTPEEVKERVKNYIEVGGGNGQFALYLCNLGKTTPESNIRAAIETVHRHGIY